MHFIGTTIAVLMIFAWMATGHEDYLVLALVGSYGVAWFSHLVAGHSRSATFWHPLWSLRAVLLMYVTWLNGTLDDEFRRAGIRERRAYSRKGRIGASGSSARSAGVPAE
jgi:hypothetical protein